MVFSSLIFLCVFLPVVFFGTLLVRCIPAQNILLLVASLLFYAYGEPVYVLLMVAMSLVVYVLGLAMGNPCPDDSGNKRKRTGLLAIAMVLCLGCLGFFKYANWFVDTVNALVNLAMPTPNVTLPVGISFFTFQAMSYVIDVYRGEVAPQHNFVHILLYISFFPQLIAGPIVRYEDIDNELTQRSMSSEAIATGLRRFIVGLAKKVLIADVLSLVVDSVYAADQGQINALLALVATFAYMLQIYLDFSAYSDMAIGMARMFGFSFPENFNYPYISLSIQEFWRRWHISLSTWLRDYLYIPLGGNRKGHARTVLNKIFVFFCCGLWHGAAWTFVAWGLLHGLFLLLEEYLPIRKLPKPLAWVYTIAVVSLTFVLFRADTFNQATFMYGQLFAGWGSFTDASLLLGAKLLTKRFWVTFVLGIVACFPLLPWLKGVLSHQSLTLQRSVDIASYAICFALLLLCMLTLAGGAYSPFIYFRF